jgi:hypothetical protein
MSLPTPTRLDDRQLCVRSDAGGSRRWTVTTVRPPPGPHHALAARAIPHTARETFVHVAQPRAAANRAATNASTPVGRLQSYRRTTTARVQRRTPRSPVRQPPCLSSKSDSSVLLPSDAGADMGPIEPSNTVAADDNQRSRGARRTIASPRRTARRLASTGPPGRRRSAPAGAGAVAAACEVLAQARSPAPRASRQPGAA